MRPSRSFSLPPCPHWQPSNPAPHTRTSNANTPRQQKWCHTHTHTHNAPARALTSLCPADLLPPAVSPGSVKWPAHKSGQGMGGRAGGRSNRAGVGSCERIPTQFVRCEPWHSSMRFLMCAISDALSFSPSRSTSKRSTSSSLYLEWVLAWVFCRYDSISLKRPPRCPRR